MLSLVASLQNHRPPGLGSGTSVVLVEDTWLESNGYFDPECKRSFGFAQLSPRGQLMTDDASVL